MGELCLNQFAAPVVLMPFSNGLSVALFSQSQVTAAQ